MKFYFYKQPDSFDCGSTCLRLIAKHYSKSISLQALREKTQVGKEGVNLLAISEAAETIGFRIQSLKLSYKALTKDTNSHQYYIGAEPFCYSIDAFHPSDGQKLLNQLTEKLF